MKKSTQLIQMLACGVVFVSAPELHAKSGHKPPSYGPPIPSTSSSSSSSPPFTDPSGNSLNLTADSTSGGKTSSHAPDSGPPGIYFNPSDPPSPEISSPGGSSRPKQGPPGTLIDPADLKCAPNSEPGSSKAPQQGPPGP